MIHEVTIAETKGIDEYWLMRAIKNIGCEKQVITEADIGVEPTLMNIANFLTETKADFISVAHNYRWANK